jgi:hypothetical protein
LLNNKYYGVVSKK